jgi:hypothetical protein
MLIICRESGFTQNCLFLFGQLLVGTDITAERQPRSVDLTAYQLFRCVKLMSNMLPYKLTWHVISTGLSISRRHVRYICKRSVTIHRPCIKWRHFLSPQKFSSTSYWHFWWQLHRWSGLKCHNFHTEFHKNPSLCVISVSVFVSGDKLTDIGWADGRTDGRTDGLAAANNSVSKRNSKNYVLLLFAHFFRFIQVSSYSDASR